MNTGLLGPAVATVLTVYGIETAIVNFKGVTKRGQVATVLTVYGIETANICASIICPWYCVATVLTVYGIETLRYERLNPYRQLSCNSAYRLRY